MIKYTYILRVFAVCALLLCTQQWAQQTFVTPKKKHVLRKALKETVAEQCERAFMQSVDCLETIARWQKKILHKRDEIEQFVHNADEATLQEHKKKLEHLSACFDELQKTCLDTEKFCIP